MALERNEPVFISPEDEQKYRQLQVNYKSACERFHELSELILKLKEAEYDCAPKLNFNSNVCEPSIDTMIINKSDYDLLIKWKSILKDFYL